jgi:hypothetical protein
MTPQDHWNNILLSNPQYRSANVNGWDFRRDEPKKASLRGVFAAFAGALIIAVVAFIIKGF